MSQFLVRTFELDFQINNKYNLAPKRCFLFGSLINTWLFNLQIVPFGLNTDFKLLKHVKSIKRVTTTYDAITNK